MTFYIVLLKSNLIRSLTVDGKNAHNVLFGEKRQFVSLYAVACSHQTRLWESDWEKGEKHVSDCARRLPHRKIKGGVISIADSTMPTPENLPHPDPIFPAYLTVPPQPCWRNPSRYHPWSLTKGSCQSTATFGAGYTFSLNWLSFKLCRVLLHLPIWRNGGMGENLTNIQKLIWLGSRSWSGLVTLKPTVPPRFEMDYYSRT